MKNYILTSLSVFIVSCNYSGLTCSGAKLAESMKNCSSYECEKPFMGVSYVVSPLNNSMCKVSVGFDESKEFMSCLGKVNEFAASQAIVYKWSKSNKVKQAQYDIANFEIEYFIEGKSIGKPFSNLASENKCNYAKKP